MRSIHLLSRNVTAAWGRCSLTIPVRATSTTYFGAVPLAPPDSILGLAKDFNADPDPSKVNLAVGVYRDDDNKPYVLRCVREAAARVIKETHMDYAPIAGLPSYIQSTKKLCFGDAIANSIGAKRIASVQTLSGTGALRMSAELLSRFHGTGSSPVPLNIHVPNPTYPNHVGIYENCGIKLKYYPYYNSTTHGIDEAGMLDYLSKLHPTSIVLFHACAHNPTGCDPTPEQWKKVADCCEERGLVVVVDMAYQGFASGLLDKDAFLPRHLCGKKLPALLVCQSFAKNFGLYGQRAGALHVVCSSPEEVNPVFSQLEKLIRPMYSNPPVFGARIVDTVLRDEELTKLWYSELENMSGRMSSIRTRLVKELVTLGSKRYWDHLATGYGMMGLTGLTEEQVMQVRRHHHIYLTLNGRLAFSGLNNKNVQYVARALHEVTK